MGGIYVCGCKGYIDFLILLIATPLVYALFAEAFRLFVHKKKCFSFLFQYFL